uniref:Uncharacterized protein n=1 Tax=Oryza sativa subsp. japonica TaxID=39947 RepID=Q6YX44_ORYSJ|nr:hypothetical protein [Oryza sativa Japonica Group]
MVGDGIVDARGESWEAEQLYMCNDSVQPTTISFPGKQLRDAIQVPATSGQMRRRAGAAVAAASLGGGGVELWWRRRSAAGWLPSGATLGSGVVAVGMVAVRMAALGGGARRQGAGACLEGSIHPERNISGSDR